MWFWLSGVCRQLVGRWTVVACEWFLSHRECKTCSQRHHAGSNTTMISQLNPRSLSSLFQVLCTTAKFASILEQSRFIQLQYRGTSGPKLYLLIHNIDGPGFRTQAVQTAFSYIAASDRVHMVATVDHINAPLQWDQVLTHRFNWVSPFHTS